MDDKEIKEARFGLDDWVGNRVSKYDDHAFDEVMTPRWFDGYNGYLDEEIEKLLPPLPKKTTMAGGARETKPEKLFVKKKGELNG